MRKLMWFTVGFCGACAFGAYCYVDWLLTAAAITVTLSLVVAVLTYWNKHFRIATAVCIGAALGLCWFWGYDSIHLDSARAVNGQTLEATIYVQDYSYETDYGTAVDGMVFLGDDQYKVRVYLNDKLDLEPGNRLVGDFKFQITTGSAEDVRYHRGNGMFLLCYQRGNVVTERFWSVPLICYPAVWRYQLQNIIENAFPEDVFAFAKALLLGDRNDIDYETNTAFKISGISHIIAVSGLHVSILFGLVYFISGRRRSLTALIGIPTVVIFAALVGFSPSVTRAAIMQVVMMLALLSGKEYDPLTALSCSALVMLLSNPLVVSSVSFMLSFACMSGIGTFSEPIRAWLMHKTRFGRWKGKLVNWFTSGVSVSIGSAVLTTPLVAFHFGCVSLVSVVTNLLTVWAVSFIFYGIMVVCLLGLVHAGAAAAVGALVAWPIRYVLVVSQWISRFPLAAVYTQSIYIVAWLIVVYILLAVFLCIKGKPVKLMMGLAGLLLCLCVIFSWVEPVMDTCRVTVLDVGQGQAILLQSEGRTYLVDCGGDFDEDSADITAEKLLSQGIDRLDGVILTHYDRDHSGGVQYLLTRINADLLLLPHSMDENGVAEPLKEMADQTFTVMDDLVFRFGGTEMTLFAPFSYHSGNESSMSVLFKTENCAILITGDMGEDGERMLLKYHDLPQVDVLVVGHHGSKTSTSTQLLDAVRPSYAFISVGEDNKFGHPADIIIQRLLEYGCVIYRTDEDGTIVYRG